MRFKWRNLLIGGVIYAAVLAPAAATGIGLFVVLPYIAICMFLGSVIVRGAERRRSAKSIEFSHTNPASTIGREWGSFIHAFCCEKTILGHYKEALAAALAGKLACPPAEVVAFKDLDRNLPQPETRTLLKATSPSTLRNTGFSLLCHFSKMQNVQAVRWWVLVSGVRDPNKVFWWYVLAPLAVPFVLWPYWKREFDPLDGLTTIDMGFFNANDVQARTRALHLVAFETLIETLNFFGVDTADLKDQRGNVLNINVSGGTSTFGNIVQGAVKSVSNYGHSKH
jgi:hypothetical protein